MLKAILALRSYPMALFMALLLLACSLVIASASVGILSNGDDDQGSDMGGTSKSCSFGDTCGPNSLLGGADTNTDDVRVVSDTDQWPTPWLPREQETAGIPVEMQKLIELQRNPPQNPFRQNHNNQLNSPALHILDPAKTLLPPQAQRILEMGNSAESDQIQPVLLIEIRIPESLPEPDLADMRPYLDMLAQ